MLFLTVLCSAGVFEMPFKCIFFSFLFQKLRKTNLKQVEVTNI